MKTLGELVSKLQQFKSLRALQCVRPGQGDPTTFGELELEIDCLSSAFLHMGIKKEDRVLLLSENDKRRLTCDLALLSIGAVVIPRGSDSTGEEIQYILHHSNARWAFVENENTLSLLGEKPASLEKTVLLNDFTTESRERKDSSLFEIGGYEEALQLGKELLHVKGGSLLQKQRQRVSPADVATIVYTSGTTGTPKGVVLTHENICHNIKHCPVLFRRKDQCLTILPSWHMMGRTTEFIILSGGGTIIYTDPRHFFTDLSVSSPSAILGVPRLWEKIHENIFATVDSRGRIFRTSLKALFALLRASNRALLAWHYPQSSASPPSKGRLGSFLLLALHPLLLPLKKMLHRRIRKALGGAFRLGVSGGGSLPEHVDEFFSSLDFALLNGYGLTETSPILTVRTPKNNIPGTVGKPLPKTEIQIRSKEGHKLSTQEKGVIWARGPQVMKRYYLDPTGTKDVLDREGWLNTGDIGKISSEGNLSITGRAKETIVLRSGENVEPAPIENAILTTPFIDQVLVVGQDQKFLGALIVPNRERCKEHWLRTGNSAEDNDFEGLLKGEVRRCLCERRGFKKHEAVVVFNIAKEPFTQENNLLTRTGKLKRTEIRKRYSHEIEQMFGTLVQT